MWFWRTLAKELYLLPLVICKFCLVVFLPKSKYQKDSTVF